MNEPKSEYGWRFVENNDLKEGDEHWETVDGKSCWAECVGRLTDNCSSEFRRRKIVAPEGWRILALDEVPHGDCLASDERGVFAPSTWTHNDETVSQLKESKYPKILAIAAPVKKEFAERIIEAVYLPIMPEGFEPVIDRTLKIQPDWKWATPNFIFGKWCDCGLKDLGRGQLKDACYCRPATGSYTLPKPFVGHQVIEPPKFHVGDPVHKKGGDYYFDGTIVAVFLKLSGKVRYVAENFDGVLHIFSENNLEKTNG